MTTTAERPKLPHWSSYDSVKAWYGDDRGYVPIQIAHGLSEVMKKQGLSSREAYRELVDRGAIIHIDPADDGEPEDPQ